MASGRTDFGERLQGLRVAMVLSNDAASDPRVDKEARALAAEGARVTVVAWDRSLSLCPAEDRGAYDVRRLGPAARHGAGLGNLGAYRVFWRDAADAVAALRPDVVHCHDTDTAPVGLRVLRKPEGRGCRLVLDLHELYRDSRMIPRRGLRGAAARAAVWWIERRAARRAAAVVVANPGQAGLVAGLRADDPRIAVVENAPELGRFEPGGRAREAGAPLRVCYVGQKRTTERLVDLMDAIAATPGTRALIAGGGPAAEAVESAARGRERVEVLGRVGYDEIAALYAGCDAVYAVYDTSVGNYRTHFPVKAMEAMAVGVPVLVSRGTWVAEYVERHGLGEAVAERDVGGISSVLAKWRDDPEACRRMGHEGRAIVEAAVNWEAASRRLVDTYVERVGAGGSRREGDA